ncbi:conserved hypothetical protein [Ricinus communis]|uniref:Uncharacterized protein n=1 Tax=Ricinus communis TaxID=3988 RepID=B9TLH7_RICCO|nr:conserved hypothetical protein [Ricinus communis]
MKFVAMTIFHVPSVTMNGGSFILATRKPLSSPQMPPTARPATIATGVGKPYVTATLPMTTEEMTMMTPIERSMPAVRMTSVWAAPRMPTMAICCRMSVSV